MTVPPGEARPQQLGIGNPAVLMEGDLAPDPWRLAASNDEEPTGDGHISQGDPLPCAFRGEEGGGEIGLGATP